MSQVHIFKSDAEAGYDASWSSNHPGSYAVTWVDAEGDQASTLLPPHPIEVMIGHPVAASWLSGTGRDNGSDGSSQVIVESVAQIGR
ncbi:unnamed protein product [Chrysoparadoxa australica]